jgi:hypothetical protein
VAAWRKEGGRLTEQHPVCNAYSWALASNELTDTRVALMIDSFYKHSISQHRRRSRD